MSLREIVVISGKGGTGKTTLTACFTALAEEPKILADADVDAPNLGLLLFPAATEERPFFGMEIARVDTLRCVGCGACEKFCRFRAISVRDGKAVVDPGFCEGCGGCLFVCPEGCISKEKFQRGVLRRGETAFGALWHARLAPGGENSGMLVALLRKEARREAEKKGISLLLTDGPPGVGCPVISSLTGASFALLVSEPSLSALSDLRRVAALCRMLSVPFGVAVNRWDLSREMTGTIKKACDEESWPFLGTIPFAEKTARAVNEGRIPVKEMGEPLRNLWRSIVEKGCGI
jgi:MinD superfamily P-loop ATPase